MSPSPSIPVSQSPWGVREAHKGGGTEKRTRVGDGETHKGGTEKHTIFGTDGHTDRYTQVHIEVVPT